jgi:membrane protein required for beta-lactamase induction
MTLIIILIGLAFEHFIGVSDKIRRFNWFERYIQWLENRFAGYQYWNSGLGVILTLAGPLFLVALLAWGLSGLFYPLGLLFALAVLVYSLGPRYLNPQLDELIRALENEDETHVQELLSEFSIRQDSLQPDQKLVENILLQANERIFGILFWFIILGPFGAMMYRITCLLWQRQKGIHGEYSVTAGDLYNILNWPTARLMVLGNALMGNMVDAIEAWREAEQQSFSVNEHVICTTGLGALNFQQPDYNDENISDTRIFWLRAVKDLLNRNLVTWLTILGLMTLSGWLS